MIKIGDICLCNFYSKKMEFILRDVLYEILFLVDKHTILNFCSSCKRLYEIIFVCDGSFEFWIGWVNRRHKFEFTTLEIFDKFESNNEKMEKIKNYFMWKNQKDVFGKIIETNLYKTSKSIWKINNLGQLVMLPLDLKSQVKIFDNPYYEGFREIIGTVDNYCIVVKDFMFHLFDETGLRQQFFGQCDFLYIEDNIVSSINGITRTRMCGLQNVELHDTTYVFGNIITYSKINDDKKYYANGFTMRKTKSDADFKEGSKITPHKVIKFKDEIYLFDTKKVQNPATFIFTKSKYEEILLYPKNGNGRPIHLFKNK